MPQFFVEAPFGITPTAKQKMMTDLTAAIEEAYHFGDVRIWLREYSPDNVAMDGRLGAEPIKPLCFLEAPELTDHATKTTLVTRILAAVDEAYRELANTAETLVLMNHYPLENAAWAGRLGSDLPDAVAAIARLNA